LSPEDSAELVKTCPMKVFALEDLKVKIEDPRKCTLCRECISKEKFRGKVRLKKVRNHFLCNCAWF